MKVVICDSNQKNVNAFIEGIEQVDGEYSIKSVNSIFELVTYLYDDAKGDVDLLLINVRVSGENGIKAAKEIQDFYPHINVIFTADNCEYAKDIFLIRPIYFLKIPLEKQYLEKALIRAGEIYAGQLNHSLTLKFRNNVFRLDYSNIYYIESQGRKIVIYATGNQWEANMTMTDILGRLPQNFKLCHRSYIVNIEKIKNILHGELILTNNIRIPISQKRVSEFTNAD